MNWLALDIGGAHIKAADGRGFAAAYPFALWKNSDGLTHELRRIISEAPECDHLVATMTGELADCFDNKEQGVLFIIQSLHDASDGRHTRVYVSDGNLVTPVVARRRYAEVASANWHALARYVGRFMELGVALLIDVGSTTCDVIPFRDGFPAHSGLNDTQRLLSGELVYTGVQRSPVCAVSGTVPYRDHLCPLAQELFATMLDVYVILGEIPEDPASHYTADGRTRNQTLFASPSGPLDLCRQRTVQPSRCGGHGPIFGGVPDGAAHGGDGASPATRGRDTKFGRDLRAGRVPGAAGYRAIWPEAQRD